MVAKFILLHLGAYMNNGKKLTLTEAVQLTGRSRWTLRRYVKKGMLKATYVNHSPLFTEAQLKKIKK